VSRGVVSVLASSRFFIAGVACSLSSDRRLFIILLQHQRTYQLDNGLSVREEPDHVGAPLNLLLMRARGLVLYNLLRRLLS